jgi:hypothetical protein
VVVGAEEVERGIEEAGLRQADEHRVGAVLGAEAAVAQARARAAGLLEPLGIAHLGAEAAAALEDPQDVARLRALEVGQRIEELHHALVIEIVPRRRWHRLHPLRRAVHAVALAVA